MTWFIPYIILGTIITLLFAKFAKIGSGNCPREYKNYTCHGKDCDHSEKAWRML